MLKSLLRSMVQVEPCVAVVSDVPPDAPPGTVCKLDLVRNQEQVSKLVSEGGKPVAKMLLKPESECQLRWEISPEYVENEEVRKNFIGAVIALMGCDNFDRVQPCYDCGLHTVPRDDSGNPLRGQCEYFRVPNSLWRSVVSDARFLCVGCFEQRLGRRLVWQDFLISGGEVGAPEDSDENMRKGTITRSSTVWCDSKQFDSPRLAKRKWPGPSRGYQRQHSIFITKATLEDFRQADLGISID